MVPESVSRDARSASFGTLTTGADSSGVGAVTVATGALGSVRLPPGDGDVAHPATMSATPSFPRLELPVAHATADT